MKILAYISPGQKQSPARVYRGEGILEKLNAQVDYMTPEMFGYDWAQWMRLAKQYDWLYLMRPALPNEVGFASRAAGFGLKLWYDLDDDYTGVEPDNTAFPTFQRQDVQDSFKWFLANSHVITYSTNYLLKKFGRGHLAPNALDDQIFDLGKEYPKPERKLITWRGGGSHFQDLQYFGENIFKAMLSNQSFTFHFLGFYPYFLTQAPNLRCTQYIPDYWYFMQEFERLKPWGHIVPLRDCAFNRAKSCIAAMEAIYAGAVPVVPNFEEFEIPGALVYNDRQDFEKQVNALCKMSDEEHKERWTIGSKWLRETRSLTTINRKRIEILKAFNE